ncbi:MAG TPA: peptidylprolyl isomerase [Caulobacteraceae bacterium]|nr:peptidylprolyl isomerase [Caulobacteraceae bacterium]
MKIPLILGAAAAMLALAAPALAAPPVPPPGPTAADWRTPDPANVLVIDTTKGRILVELAPIAAPQSAARIRELAKAGFYDGRAFFRVIDDFMDQTGDPTDTGAGGSAKPDLPAEFTFRLGSDTPMVAIDSGAGRQTGFIGPMPVASQTLDLAAMTADHRVEAYVTYCAGVVGMARAQDPNSGNSQFFLMRSSNANLDQKYTAAGRVIAGMDVVRAIKTGEPVAPPQDKMLTVRVLSDLPPAQRPAVRVIDPRGAWFQAEVARVRAEKVVGLSACDLDLPSQVTQPR